MKTKIIISNKKQHGSSLLETMISLFVLAIGLLGTLAMQNKSIQHNQNSYAYSQAIVLATDLNERLRISADPAATYAEWTADLQRQIPAGRAKFNGADAFAPVAKGQIGTINITFKESAAGLGSGNERTISFRTWL